jgi:chemotaxis protein MotB
MKRLITGTMIASLVLLLGSCVTSKRYKDLESRCNQTARERDSLLTLSRNLSTSLADANTDRDVLNKSLAQMKEDTLNLGKQLRYLKSRNDEVSDLNKTLEENYQKLLSGNEQETGRILTELREAQNKLQGREDELTKLQLSLDEKSRRLQELEKALAEKDRDVKELRNKVMDALKGFKDSGLTVEIKNGKVYVSMSEKLLFASGSTEVDQKGKEALVQLAKVLEKETEINITIEGHTDNVPLKGTGCLKDNWDLSVARATAIVKILLASGKIDASRLTASGRGEFLPVAPNDSADNKAKNRRTEIILTPKLDKLFDILN